ncbi:MAG TPA: prepilin-type N-terminal cleavage/methylation domain-containing protein [Candidatus Saccharimonadales bacterium]
MLEILKKKRQEGFTLVELLIVIVIIAILAALVIVTFSGVQQRARNTERQTDVAALAKYLEIFYADNAKYLAQNDMSDTAANIKLKLPGLDTNALVAPQASNTNSYIVGAGAENPTTVQYGYKAWTDVAKTTACTTTGSTCLKYTLYWNEEGVGVKSKDSSN